MDSVLDITASLSDGTLVSFIERPGHDEYMKVLLSPCMGAKFQYPTQIRTGRISSKLDKLWVLVTTCLQMQSIYNFSSMLTDCGKWFLLQEIR